MINDDKDLREKNKEEVKIRVRHQSSQLKNHDKIIYNKILDLT